LHKNVHTGPAEHNHIDLSKKPAGRKQMQKDNFDWHVSNRLVDKYVVNLLLEYMKQRVGPPPNVVHPPGTLLSLPHSMVYFELCIHPVDGCLHVFDIAIDNPKSRTQ
jgi:hypothetical protein